MVDKEVKRLILWKSRDVPTVLRTQSHFCSKELLKRIIPFTKYGQLWLCHHKIDSLLGKTGAIRPVGVSMGCGFMTVVNYETRLTQSRSQR